jgi:hypothetical protein
MELQFEHELDDPAFRYLASLCAIPHRPPITLGTDCKPNCCAEVDMDDRRVERRKSTWDAEDEMSPEVLAVLALCGGRIRASDRALLSGSVREFPDRRRRERRGADLSGQPELF